MPSSMELRDVTIWALTSQLWEAGYACALHTLLHSGVGSGHGNHFPLVPVSADLNPLWRYSHSLWIPSVGCAVLIFGSRLLWGLLYTEFVLLVYRRGNDSQEIYSS
jgi:hypothetical protein